MDFSKPTSIAEHDKLPSGTFLYFSTVVLRGMPIPAYLYVQCAAAVNQL